MVLGLIGRLFIVGPSSVNVMVSLVIALLSTLISVYIGSYLGVKYIIKKSLIQSQSIKKISLISALIPLAFFALFRILDFLMNSVSPESGVYIFPIIELLILVFIFSPLIYFFTQRFIKKRKNSQIKMFSKKELITIIISLIILVIIGTFFYFNTHKTEPEANTIEINPEKEFSNQQKYKNEKYNFSLSYPKDLILCDYINSVIIISNRNSHCPDSIVEDDKILEIREDKIIGKVEKTGTVNFNGNTGYQVNNSERYIFERVDGSVIQIKINDKYKILAEKILSTLSMPEINQKLDTNNWKKYSNPVYAIEMKIPQDYSVYEYHDTTWFVSPELKSLYTYDNPIEEAKAGQLSIKTYPLFEVVDYEIHLKTTLNEWINELIKKENFYQKEAITINNKPGFKVTYNNNLEDADYFFEDGGFIYKITIYNLGNINNREEAETIISTLEYK